MAPPRGGGGTTSGGNGDGRGKRYRWKSIEKRTRGLCKKAYELATLCDVDVALIRYLPGVDPPTIWPPECHKIEQVINRYVDAPADKKHPKNQITLHIPNPAAENAKEAGEAAAAADAVRIRVPFPYDEDKLIAIVRYLDSKIVAVRRMIAARRMERRSEPALGAAPAEAVASGGDGDPGTADRDRGKRVARDYGPVWGWVRPDFSAVAAAAAARGGGSGGVPNSSRSCLCCYCPHHRHWFAGFDGRSASRDGSDGK